MKRAIIITSINAPNAVMRSLAEGANGSETTFLVIGDTKSPEGFALAGCTFLSIKEQLRTGFKFAGECPVRHYARKNIGYLLAIKNGARTIIETDDDNFPRHEFFGERAERVAVAVAVQPGWLNVYRYFSDANLWPRGFPLTYIKDDVPAFEGLKSETLSCPIQQGLVDENPDVDAICRLIMPLPQNFKRSRRVALGRGVWCPFNSQNTTWFPPAYPLLYLPAHCSFRMTDIWRSFVAQRIAWENGWNVLFHEPTAYQERNEHNLMRDFADEIPGYLQNDHIKQTLSNLPLKGGQENVFDNLRMCYESLVEIGVVGAEELPLLEAWIWDLQNMRTI